MFCCSRMLHHQGKLVIIMVVGFKYLLCFVVQGCYRMSRFGYLEKFSPCAYESLSTKGEDYYPSTLLYDSNFTFT
jgi:hypothetical protein